jgi:hypothetical protein
MGKEFYATKVKLTGDTNNGSNNILEFYDSDNVLIEKINSDGFYQLRYRDEYVAGDWIFPTGGAAPDFNNVTIGGVTTRMYSFDGGATTEWMANSFELNHDAAIVELNAETAKLEFHVHFMPSTNDAGVVEWSLEYCYLPAHATAIAQTTLVASYTVLENTQYTHLITGVELPKPSSGFNIGDIILFNLKRIPTGTDTYPADALLIKCALHVPVDGQGSRQRYTK